MKTILKVFSAVGITALAALTLAATTFAQPPAGFGGAAARAPAGTAAPTAGAAAPTAGAAAPTAVALPTKLSGEIEGPGPMFDSAPSQAPGLGLDHFKYQTKEYFVRGPRLASRI